ncbi:hypothetical protein BJH93_04095 [Kocuria polaris]|nr:hypothetical protein [Kocuria polaris]
MDEELARERLDQGLSELTKQAPAWTKRDNYLRGDQDLPYAPEGVNAEYEELRRTSVANWMSVAMSAPTQRLQAEGIKTGDKGEADQTIWSEVWEPNRLDSRQSIVFRDMYTHGRGIMSVSAVEGNRKTPKIRPESGLNVYLGTDPDDPFTHTWAIKRVTVKAKRSTGLIGLDGTSLSIAEERAYVYDENNWVLFVKTTNGFTGEWKKKDEGRHGLGELPFVAFDFNVDAVGRPTAAADGLIPQQDAINTIRFNTLLAMQFSAFRQRVFTGFDPVVRDSKGDPLVKKDAEGNPVLDANGQKIPIVRSPGRVGVDRALVFPGGETKVFDLPESNLDNYIKVLSEFLTTFFAIGQIPPQYMLTKMANLSGDALDGAESTLQSLTSDLKRAGSEGLRRVFRLAQKARGEQAVTMTSHVIWADTQPRSFSQTVDAIVKLISSGMARQDAWDFLPESSPDKLKDWTENAAAERRQQDEELNAVLEKTG